MTTRSIHLRGGVDRDAAENEGTVIADLRGLRVRSGRTGVFFLADVPEASFEELFVRHAAELADAHARHAHEAGVLIAAIVPGFGLRAHAWLAADARLRSAIVGRHEHADLHLPDDPSLSLRHLAVLVRAGEGGAGGVHVRVLDLRTGMRFQDEAGRELGAVSANGPLLLRASMHRLFLLPTGDGRPLGAWETLPPRRFEDARSGTFAARPAASVPPRFVDLREPTVVTANAPLAPPEFLELVEPGEAPLGQLVVRSGGRATVVSLGAERAGRGVLIGRYDRCDGVVPMRWFGERVSRVHAFLLLDRGELHVIDAGSTNGTSIRNQPIRCDPMPVGERVDIADASLEWNPAH